MKVYDCDNLDQFKALEQLEEEKRTCKKQSITIFCS